jgi:hypothetical protein
MSAIGRGVRLGALAVVALTAAGQVDAQAPTQYSIAQLLGDGWEIAGFAPSLAMVGSVILFKHKDRNFFVQCTAVYDATRSHLAAERVVTNCYEIR